MSDLDGIQINEPQFNRLQHALRQEADEDAELRRTLAAQSAELAKLSAQLTATSELCQKLAEQVATHEKLFAYMRQRSAVFEVRLADCSCGHLDSMLFDPFRSYQ